ncbi:MAG: hypothetical protein OEW91_13015 [Acidimicrobiia bacterium]|nr:hypothetical protein [Acidimicrobiia bacterium]
MLRSSLFPNARRRTWAAALACAVAAFGSATGAGASGPPDPSGQGTAPISVTGLQTPESALYDAGNDVYLVSNFGGENGSPLAVDNDGFISRIAPDGTVLDPKFITGGLSAPKGMAMVGHTLYVVDIGTVHLFDVDTGEASGAVPIPGAAFLNDIAAARNGTVYVSDTGFKVDATLTGFEPSGTDAIYEINRQGQVSVLAQGNALLHHPNGVAVKGSGEIAVVTYDPFDGVHELLVLDRHGRLKTTSDLPAGLLDGVVLVNGQRAVVSSWETASIYEVQPGGQITQIATNLPSPADIGFDPQRSRILIPLMIENSLVILPYGR